MTKNDIRKATLMAVEQLPAPLRTQYEDQLLTQLLNKVKKESIKALGFYYGFHPEVDTSRFFDELWQEGVQVYLPRIQPKRQLTFHLYQSKDPLDIAFNGRVYQPLATAPKKDPQSLDCIIVPGVAFKKDGHRIGHGGGYYDRLLEPLSVKTCSLVFPEQVYEDNHWTAQEHDCSVDELLVAQIKREG